ncbi:MAG TPA: hypothetical protein ENF30_00575 [Candidatus Desulfofervidus auxilii]|uniref:Uncharacterized protein n=1 Tax=Desulfofervidus auxilii TaxID=1621989 RepID=A0A7V0NEJ2_DESA2|nr:hypothetical protein [Candidatus Desulfofervidus auxilii]
MAKFYEILLIGIPLEIIQSACEQLNWKFKLVLPQDEKGVVQELLGGEYNLVFINSDYLKTHPHIEHIIIQFPQEKRRRTIFILIDAELETLNPFSAFYKSVNAIVNPRDLPNLAEFLPHIIRAYEKLYRGFQKAQEELEIF